MSNKKSHARKETENKYVFKWEQKTGRVVADVTSVDRLFHKRLPATWKARSPTVTTVTAVTSSENVQLSLKEVHYVRPSVVCLSSVCNVRAPYSGDWNFRQCFYAICYLGHLWPFGKHFTEIFLGEPLRRGLNRRGVAKYSDFGFFQGYVSETVQDRRKVRPTINY